VRTSLLIIGLAATVCTPHISAQEHGNAQSLYEQHCTSCHGTEVYTRTDRKVTSPLGLERQVQRCETALGLRWFDEDISEMTRFLNERYYHFKP
jgi:hypothetical protein